MTPKGFQLDGPTTLVEVRDAAIAAALRAVDVPFFNPDRPSTLLAFADGRRVPCFRFRAFSTDGKHNAAALAKAAVENPYGWIEKNPDHPFAYALSAALRAAQYIKAAEESRALVGFKLKGEKLSFVFENSRKAERLKAAGAIQI